MRIKATIAAIIAFLPQILMAQAQNGQNGADMQYGFGWWLWTAILLLIVALIVVWAVKTGSRSGPSSGLPGQKGGS